MPVYPSPRAKYDISDPASYSGTGNTVYDLSGNNYDLTLTSTTYQSTVEATSLVFNGSTSKAIYNGSIGVDTGDPYTFLMWVNPISFVNPYDIFFSYGQDDGLPLLAYRFGGSNVLRFETGSGSNTIAPGTPTTLNQWNCYCITYDATTYKLYKDGVLLGSVAGSRYIGVPTKISIGCFDNTTYFCNMKFGYLEAWDQALTGAEVLSKYQETKVNFKANLVTYLDFLDPACFTNGGTAVNDLSAANNDWTLENLSYTYNAGNGTLALSGCRFTSNLQALLGTGNVSFSISFWNYFDSTQYDIVYYNGNYPASLLHIDTDNANSCYAMRYGNPIVVTNTPTVTMNAWHNITYVYDHTTTTSKVYIDNAQVLTYNYSLSQGVSGTYPGVQFADYWNGTGVAGLGLIYFYTRAISALEVEDIYNENSARFLPPAPALIAQYDVSDITSYSGTGNTLYDISGNANNLTLYNSPTFSGTGQSKTLLFEGFPEGNQYADSAAIASVPGTITINAWFEASDPASWYATVFAVSVGLVGVLAWSDYGNNFVYNFQLNNTVVPSAIPFNPSGFDNIIASISNGNSVYYVNGVQVATSSTAVSNFNNVNIQLNGYPGGGIARMGTYAFGLFELYNTAYDPGQVVSLYNSQATRFGAPPAPLPTPIGEYDFSNVASYPGTGGTLYDLSGTGNTLTNPTLSGTFGGTGQSKYYSFAGGADQFYKAAVAGFAGTQLFTGSHFIWVKSSDWNNPPQTNAYNYMTGWGLDTGSGGGHLGFVKQASASIFPSGALAMMGSAFGATFFPGGLTNNDWQHLGYVADGTDCNLYLNGSLVGSIPQDWQGANPPYFGPTGILGFIGRDPSYAYTPWITLGGLYSNYAPGSNFDIAIAEFYNVGFGSTQVLQLYNSQESRFAAGPPPYVGSVGGRIFAEGLNG